MTDSRRSPIETLQRYWGYDSFRELQAEIIDSVLNGHDTLGLLPTGGGKSITFQVPAMMLDGLTVVVTPLISLMKDQVDNLRARGIKAGAIYSGLSRGEYKLTMDRCRLGKMKLLYLSPERLQSKSFIEQLRQMDVSLIVVDEAHCISQWGYDFRPSYLRIANLRNIFPDAPVMALTASATPEVTDDIMTQLHFRERNVFARSFSRPNISYVARYTDNKPGMLLRVLQSTSGTAIVYVRSRRRTREIATMLSQAGISADYYHAGLAVEDKNEKQNRWKSNQTRVMVATNAFGMGIDKPDVRVVVHIDPPSSLEEYYQEAGRAGRDGLPSYAVIIAAPAVDKGILTRRLNEAFPDKDLIRKIYEQVGNFLEVAVGDGFNTLYEFNFQLFCDRFGFKPAIVHSALSLLTRAEYFDFVEETTTRSRVIILMNKNELYDLQLDDTTDRVFNFILRNYTGLFADYVPIEEELIASRLSLTHEQVYTSMLQLARLHAVHYVPRRTTPYIFYTTSRELPKHVLLPRSVYEDQRERLKKRIDAMKSFIFDTSRCRVATMLEYFGEKSVEPCGTCDVCRSHRKQSATSRAELREKILYLAGHNTPLSIDTISSQLGVAPAQIIATLRNLMDEGAITLTDNKIQLP